MIALNDSSIKSIELDEKRRNDRCFLLKTAEIFKSFLHFLVKSFRIWDQSPLSNWSRNGREGCLCALLIYSSVFFFKWKICCGHVNAPNSQVSGIVFAIWMHYLKRFTALISTQNGQPYTHICAQLTMILSVMMIQIKRLVIRIIGEEWRIYGKMGEEKRVKEKETRRNKKMERLGFKCKKPVEDENSSKLFTIKFKFSTQTVRSNYCDKEYFLQMSICWQENGNVSIYGIEIIANNHVMAYMVLKSWDER